MPNCSGPQGSKTKDQSKERLWETAPHPGSHCPSALGQHRSWAGHTGGGRRGSSLGTETWRSPGALCDTHFPVGDTWMHVTWSLVAMAPEAFSFHGTTPGRRRETAGPSGLASPLFV